MTASQDEESPSIIGQWRWVTPTKGDFKDSATEINRKAHKPCKGGKVRQERTSSSATKMAV